MRVIVTRPLAQAKPWVQALRALGVDAQALPLIGIAPAEDSGAVLQAWQGLNSLALVMFVSANAVEQFFALRPAAVAWPTELMAASTGPGTSAALRAAGLAATQIVEPVADAKSFDSEALWAELSRRPWAGSKALLVRGEQGRNWLAEQLTAQGAEVAFVAAYQRLPPALDAPQQALLRDALAQPRQHLWLFSSSEALGHLAALVPAAHWAAARAMATHVRIAQAATQLGFGHVQVVSPSAAAVAASVQSGAL